MILYEYYCKKCKENKEVFVKMRFRDDGVICPDCKGKMVRNQAAPGLDFSKGGEGFYANEYK